MYVRHEILRGGLTRISALAAVMVAFAVGAPKLEPDGTRVYRQPVAPTPHHPGGARISTAPAARHEKKHHRQLTPAEKAAKMITAAEIEAWSMVAVCEEGGDWHVSGSEYSGGLGISNYNWVAYGGEIYAPTAATATPREQIVIAKRIQSDPPDQNGCEGAW